MIDITDMQTTLYTVLVLVT